MIYNRSVSKGYRPIKEWKKYMSKKPVVLMILDGYGLNKEKRGNAVLEASTPVMDRLMKELPAGWLWGFPTGRWATLRWVI